MKNEQKTPTLIEAYEATQTNDPTTAMLTLIWRQVVNNARLHIKDNFDHASLDLQEQYFTAVRAEAIRQNSTDALDLVRQLENKLTTV